MSKNMRNAAMDSKNKKNLILEHAKERMLTMIKYNHFSPILMSSSNSVYPDDHNPTGI
jgi:hypothetical protein